MNAATITDPTELRILFARRAFRRIRKLSRSTYGPALWDATYAQAYSDLTNDGEALCDVEEQVERALAYVQIAVEAQRRLRADHIDAAVELAWAQISEQRMRNVTDCDLPMTHECFVEVMDALRQRGMVEYRRPVFVVTARFT